MRGKDFMINKLKDTVKSKMPNHKLQMSDKGEKPTKISGLRNLKEAWGKPIHLNKITGQP